MARLIQPFGICFDERCVSDFLPVADPRRKPGKIGGSAFSRAVVDEACAREAHGYVGIAFTGAEAVAHADDENILHLNRRFRDRPASDLDADLGAGRIRDFQRHGCIAGCRPRLASAAATARRRQPGTVEPGCVIDFFKLDDDLM